MVRQAFRLAWFGIGSDSLGESSQSYWLKDRIRFFCWEMEGLDGLGSVLQKEFDSTFGQDTRRNHSVGYCFKASSICIWI